jgi:long-chain fatty acid transport protein
MKIKGAALICFVVFSVAKVFAGGFQINEHSAKAMALGGAFTAIANDPSAIYFNGAGITQLEGTQFLLGTTLITPISSFRGVYPEITEYKAAKQVFFPSHFYVSHKLSNDLFIGLGFTTPFGLGTKWDDNWPGKYLALETTVMTFSFMPTVAYKVTDQLALSASLTYNFADVKITKKSAQTPFAGDAFIKLDGKDKAAFGYNFGLLFKPCEKISVGASFRSQVKYNFDGTADATGAQQLIDAGKLPVNTNITADLKTPMNFNVGVACDVLPQLKLSLEYQFVQWTSYDTLTITFTEDKYKALTTPSPRLYENSYMLKLGGDYKLNKDISIQAGLFYDQNPVKPERLNPSLVDANRLGMSIGGHYNFSDKLGLSLAYLFVRGSQTDVRNSEESYTTGNASFDGTYNSTAYLFSISLSYSL